MSLSPGPSAVELTACTGQDLHTICNPGTLHCALATAQARQAHSDPCRAVQFAKEGEDLSKKQLALESSAKKLRAQQKEGDLARKDLETKLLMEQQKVSPAYTLMLQICQHSCLRAPGLRDSQSLCMQLHHW